MVSNAYRLCPLEHLEIISNPILKTASSTLLHTLPHYLGDHLYESFQEPHSVWRLIHNLIQTLQCPFTLSPWISDGLSSDLSTSLVDSYPSASPSSPASFRIQIDSELQSIQVIPQNHTPPPQKKRNSPPQKQNPLLSSPSLHLLFASQERFLPPQGRRVKWTKKEALDHCLAYFDLYRQKETLAKTARSRKTQLPPTPVCFLVSDYWDLKLMEKYRPALTEHALHQRLLIPTLFHGSLLTPMSYL